MPETNSIPSLQTAPPVRAAALAALAPFLDTSLAATVGRRLVNAMARTAGQNWKQELAAALAEVAKKMDPAVAGLIRRVGREVNV